MDNALRNQIKENLKNSLHKYISNFRYRNSQPLDLLIPKERKIRSVVGGLETSMGTTVWEPIAKTLAEMNGFEIINSKILRPHPFPEALAVELGSIITLRENRDTWISSNEAKNRLKELCRTIDRSELEYVPPASGTGVDLYFKKDGIEYAFDIKTVQPNVGSIKSFNKEIMEWYAYRICKEPEVEINCKIAYPYNPYSTNFWTHTPHTVGILEHSVDALVENEFWDFISGLSNTYQLITEIFTELNTEGFGQELSDLIERIHTPLGS